MLVQERNFAVGRILIMPKDLMSFITRSDCFASAAAERIRTSGGQRHLTWQYRQAYTQAAKTIRILYKCPTDKTKPFSTMDKTL